MVWIHYTEHLMYIPAMVYPSLMVLVLLLTKLLSMCLLLCIVQMSLVLDGNWKINKRINYVIIYVSWNAYFIIYVCDMPSRTIHGWVIQYLVSGFRFLTKVGYHDLFYTWNWMSQTSQALRDNLPYNIENYKDTGISYLHSYLIWKHNSQLRCYFVRSNWF